MKNFIFFASILTLCTVLLGAFRLPKTASEMPGNSEKNNDSIRSLMTTGTWIIQSIISDKACDTNGDGVETTDITSEMPVCALDDILCIKPDGKAVFLRNSFCAPYELAADEYDWSLTKDKKFTLSKGDANDQLIFKSVTEKELVMIVPSEAQGEMYYFTVTYKHPE